MRYNHHKSKKGFTLIELSIVMVVIALIIGVVLVGQDLLIAARLKKDMSSVESYNTAVNTFRLKYNALPGDFKEAVQFGFHANAYGDGNKRIQGVIKAHSTTYTTVPHLGIRPEWYYVFHHLGQSKLIDFSGDYTPTHAVNPLVTGTHFPALATNITEGDLSQGGIPGVILAHEQNNRIAGHFFRLGATPHHASKNFLNFYGGFTPRMAKQVDEKFDDGKPVTGRLTISPLYTQCEEDVYETSGQCAQGSISTSGTWLHCALASTGDYDIGYAPRSCALRVKASF